MYKQLNALPEKRLYMVLFCADIILIINELKINYSILKDKKEHTMFFTDPDHPVWKCAANSYSDRSGVQ